MVKRSKQDRLANFGSRDGTPAPNDDNAKSGKGGNRKRKGHKHKAKRKNPATGNQAILAALPSGLSPQLKEQTMIYL